jgi:hypothetical protein
MDPNTGEPVTPTGDSITTTYIDPGFAAVQRLAAEYDELRTENERLRQERDDAIDAEKIALREIGGEVERLLENSYRDLSRVGELMGERNVARDLWEDATKERDAARAEVEQLRVAAQRVLDAWDDDLPTQEEIEMLRQSLLSKHNG